MSQPDIDYLMELWGLSLMKHGSLGPFDSYDHMYAVIDEIGEGSAPWKCFVSQGEENLPPNAPNWRREEYQIWYRDPQTVIANMLDNPDFTGEFDAAPYIHLDPSDKRRWGDFMSGNYPWRHSKTQIFEEDPSTEGAMYVPIILGSDKTTVSVATGNVEYHPLYMSIGNIHSSVRRAHRNGVVPIGFLAIPKSDRKYDKDPAFRAFKRKLYHQSIASILSTLTSGMCTPEVRRCPDGHFRRVVYDLVAFIADYPEQVLLTGIVQGWCARCTAFASDLDGSEASGRRSKDLTSDLIQEFQGQGTLLWDNYGIDDEIIINIHEMISSDLLHQIIKGSFKDHLVTWVGEYLVTEHAEKRANEIMDDIDRRIAAAPPFPGLRRFPHGRCFKQWTGDDSKALMKVYLPAIAEYVPAEMVRALSAFLDFCYLMRRTDFDEETLAAVQNSIQRFHCHREMVCEKTSLCLDNTLSYTTQTIYENLEHQMPWRRSSRYNALSQMLLTNQHLDKLAALRTHFVERGILAPARLPPPTPFDNDEEEAGPINDDRVLAEVILARTRERSYPRYLDELAADISQPQLPVLTRRFLYDQIHRHDPDAISSNVVELDDCPIVINKISVFHSAVAIFYAPSDIFGIHGMRLSYTGIRPDDNVPPWMEEEYEVWFHCPHEVVRNQLANPDFAMEMDYAPKCFFDKDNQHEYKDFMSGNWVWNQADLIAENPSTHGAMFCPIILGSDKTTVLVATGQNEYYPLYLSNGLVFNSMRRAQCNAVSVVAFLTISKTDRQYQDDPKFRKFRHQLFHSSLNQILQSLLPEMTSPEVTRCANGHYRRIVYGLGPYIANYSEQVLLACVVQEWCPRCTSHSENLDADAPRRSHTHTSALLDVFDLKTLWDDYGVVGDLVQVFCTFKDHLVTWVEEYLIIVHGKASAASIMADIDHRIAAVPSFPALRWFPQG
ncbi:predicted protein [Sparassis crispa]|uniref:Uncharacterized protein n=1 Tax=Sparassis crispa TaxID=139825 RepID=A0A401H4F9_9APHY|nr:predicted protein [Sparassis crispa]GBE89318.1 predicted protein [Sparassis crispa]